MNLTSYTYYAYQPGKFAILLYYGILRKKPGIKLGAISNTISNIALTIYNTPNVLPPLILSLSQYGIHTKPFLHLINCLFNLRSLVLFQVTMDQFKLAYFTSFPQYLVLVSLTLSSKSLWYSSLIHLWLMFPFHIWKTLWRHLVLCFPKAVNFKIYGFD